MSNLTPLSKELMNNSTLNGCLYQAALFVGNLPLL